MTPLLLSWFLLCGILLAELAEAQQLITCPTGNGEPLEIKIPQSVLVDGQVDLDITKSQKNTVCNLFRVVAKDGSNTDSFSSTSDSNDFILEPVARSFHKRPWQQVKGPYTSQVQISNCNTQQCTVTIPVRESGDYKYVLMTSGHQLNNINEERARFLYQTTFGPTMSDITTDWNYGDGVKGFATYLAAQIALPATLHREYWRKHIDYALVNEHVRDSSQVPNHPCDQYSRWRDFAFTAGDYGKEFKVEAIQVAGVGEMMMILVMDPDPVRNGLPVYYEPRTVNATFEPFDVNCSIPGLEVYCGAGEFQTCYSFSEGIGGQINYRPKDRLDLQCRNFHNPKIYLPAEVWDINTAEGGPMKEIRLPSKNINTFEEMPGVIAEFRESWFVGQSWRMMVDNWSSMPVDQCKLKDSDNKWDFRYLTGIVDGTGEQLHYDGYAVNTENTVENPLSDGGLFKDDDYSSNGHVPCANSIMDFTNMDSCRLSTGDGCVPVEISVNKYQSKNEAKEGVLVCGSHGEVANNPGFIDKYDNNMFRMFDSARSSFFGGFGDQKGNAWAQIALEANDQLRQRIAWAFSQILVITPYQIDESDMLSECFLNYHDIFVRNAFGNYRDILKEVAYSPMMGEMLSYQESRSGAYVERAEGRVSRPDENFAREIMQLFTIGVNRLNIDGSEMKVDTEDDRSSIPAYDNSDIQNFARAWTGLRRHYRRGNFEGRWADKNRINPMVVEGARRDQFPKMDLFQNYIGDGYPECTDLPKKQFLRIGATYRLLGSHNLAIMHFEEYNWPNNVDLLRLLLNSTTSALYQKLCNANGSGPCVFRPQVHISSNLACDQNECNLDTVRVIQVQEDPPLYYEYLKPACVEFAFENSNKLKKIVDHKENAMCLNKKIEDAAMPACCTTGTRYATSECNYSMERVSYKTNEGRCPADNGNIGVCSWENVYFPESTCQFYGWEKGNYRTFHWTKDTCSVQARVTKEGTVAIVHAPNMDINSVLDENKQQKQKVMHLVNSTNVNFFKVSWKDGEYPSAENNCSNDTAECELVNKECICAVKVRTRRLFKTVPTLEQSVQLVHGAPNIAALDDGKYTKSADSSGDVDVYHKTGKAEYSKHTIFSVVRNDKRIFLKNYISRVIVPGSTYEFRNPVSMMSLVNPETRDAHYETDAVLDHYFYHPNTPTFIAMRLIERFGTSNPSPRFIKIVSKSFSSGKYVKKKQNISFGTGKYGDLAATIAAILLDSEAKTPALDADPSAGAFKEPLLKFIGLMRSMELERNSTARELRLKRLDIDAGQYVYHAPNVFSYFLPGYSAPGQITESELVSPEAMVINAPTVVGFLNGAFSLIDIGLSDCFGGFGGRVMWNCNYLYYNWYTYNQEKQAMASLRYQPSSTDAVTVVDELALLLTAGRLNTASRTIIQAAYSQELSDADAASALRLAQKLIITASEFHSTNTVKPKGQLRPEPEVPQPSTKPYKAIVFVNLNGGMDGFNMLIPYSGCSSGKLSYDNYKEARGDIAIPGVELHQIQATGQACSTFGLHPSLSGVHAMFIAKELTFIANMGILQQSGVTEDNWRVLHDKTSLFSHNTQTEETANVDIYDEFAGIGIGGRMLDILAADGYKTGALSVSGSAPPIVSKSSPVLVVSPNGYAKFNPITDNPVGNSNKEFGHDVTESVKELNGATTAGSTFYGDSWSDKLLLALSENSLLYEKLQQATVTAKFPSTHIGNQMATIAKLMKTKDDRGKDRDVFFAELGGFDMHFDIAAPLRSAFKYVDESLVAFSDEMKIQGIWDQVTVVYVSEFARTLFGNTGNGSDHAWGGNYFVAGGAIDGGKILGTYPDDLTNDSPIIFQPGIVIPTTPWEAVWNSIAQWFGITDEIGLGIVLPNREKLADKLFTMADLYGA